MTNPSVIRIAAFQRGLTQKQLASQAGINPRRWYRLIEDLAVPSEEELARVATVTRLPIDTVRRALAGSPDASGCARPEQETEC